MIQKSYTFFAENQILENEFKCLVCRGVMVVILLKFVKIYYS